MNTFEAFTQYTNDIRAYTKTRQPGNECQEKHTLILENLPLVVYIARRFVGKTALPLLDLIQEGNLGLIEAAEHYKPEVGPFSPFASRYIVGYILRAGIEASTLLKVSVIKLQRAKRIQKLLRDEEGITPTQIAAQLELTVPTVLELMNLRLDVLSLNQPGIVGEEESTLENTLEADQDHYEPEAIVMNHVTHASLQHLLSLLSRDERKVIALRFGLLGEEACTTTAEIVRHFRKTRKDIERIEECAMLKLKKYAQLFRLHESVA